MISKVDQRRLRDGASAKALPALDNPSKAELEERKSQLLDGMLALQSLDDLGSDEANNAAWEDLLSLQSEYDKVEKQIKEFK